MLLMQVRFKVIKKLIFITLVFFINLLILNANEIKSYKDIQENKENNKMMQNKIKIIIGSNTFIATLFDNETAKKFKTMLPITLNMNDLNNNEKYFYFSNKLPTNPLNPKIINSGDLMLWNDNSLVLFYATFPTSYKYTQIGRIDNTVDLSKIVGLNDVTITFELEK